MKPVALVTVSSYGRLHYALNLVRSIRATWSSPPKIFIGLIDGVDRPRPGFDDDVTFVDVRRLAPNFGWLAAKFDAADLCCALKPYVVRHVFDLGHAQVVYCDTDQHFFGDPVDFLDAGAKRAVVVTPHTVAPFPPGEAWSRPSLGDLYSSGILNAGLCSFRDTPSVRTYLDTWSQLVTGPGAFVQDLGQQNEQHSFNWVLAFVDDVCVHRDPRINVAYWNLHERPLRWSKLDGGPEGQWVIDGQPILSFHFSGFDSTIDRISRHDSRNMVSLDINLHALGRFYSARLDDCGRAHYEAQPYEFGSLGGDGFALHLRDALKRLERYQPAPACALDHWQEDVESILRQQLLGSGLASTLPDPLDRLRQLRPDVLHLDGYNPMFMPRFFDWYALHVHNEYPFGSLLERLTPYAWDRGAVDRLVADVVRACPELGEDEARRLLTTDRVRLLRRLGAGTTPPELVASVRADRHRFPAFQPSFCIRLIHAARADLHTTFPDPMGRDFDAFHDWLQKRLHAEYVVPDAVRKFVEDLSPSRSLARILAFLRLNPALTARFRKSGLDADLLRALIPVVPEDVGFSVDDLQVVDWWLDGDGRDRPKGRVESRLAGLLRREEAPPAISLRERVAPYMFPENGSIPHPAAAPGTPDARGLNVFGYFSSPIGLGTSSRGFSRALVLAGRKTREIVLTNPTMAPGLDLEHLMPDVQFSYPRNFVVTYPHIQCDVFAQFPKFFFEGRENLAHLAWEQRDLHPDWARRLDGYDRLFANSSFAAQAIERGTGRPVIPLPNVVEIDRKAAAAFTRADFGIPAGAFAVGLVMDASSSMERKNPIGSLRAIARAFAGRPDVFVIVKVTNGARGRYRREVEEAVDFLRASKLAFRVETAMFTEPQVHGLIGVLDLYISLHRAEGFGYTLAEAMALGVPAVASRYSGNLDFMNDANSWLVGCTEILVRRPDGPFRPGTVWADPDIEDAAAQCIEIYENRSEARRRADRAITDVEALLSPAAIARRLDEILS